MTQLAPGNNSALDNALGLLGPHDTQFERHGPIHIQELSKVIELFGRQRHSALRILDRFGTEELIEAFLKSGVFTGGHRLKYTTRVDILLATMNNSKRKTIQ